MKNLFFTLFCIVLAAPVVMAQTSWKSPVLKPESYQKVMVLAKVSDLTARRQIEDFTVKFLADKGIVAIQSYANLKKGDMDSREDFRARIDSLQVDGLLVYRVEGAEKSAENTPSVSVGVGVGGMYGGYAGASVPISGGMKIVMIVHVNASFYNRSSTETLWTLPLSGKLEENTDKLAYAFAKTTVKTMIKDKLFLSKK